MKLLKPIVISTLFWGIAFAKAPVGNVATHNSLPGRPNKTDYPITIGEVWNYIGNYGNFGGEFNQGNFGYTWPGGGAVNNYYLWGSYYWVGAKVGDEYYVTHHDYVNYEWGPSEDPPVQKGPGKSAYDVLVAFDDFKDNPYNGSGRHLGVKTIVRALAWPHEPFNDFIAHEIYVTYQKDQSDIPGVGDKLDSLFIGIVFDADVCGGDQTDPHIDDLVSFDGWTNGEWDNPNFKFRSPIDTLTLLPDSSYPEPDGVADEYVIWGDESEWEKITDSSLAVPYTRNDTTYLVYIFPRGMSYIYDSDNPAVPGDDIGEGGMCAGYIGGAFIYAPPEPTDSVIAPGVRAVRPHSHQWWNWESDPATDDEMYAYMKGEHPGTHLYQYAPHPFDLGAAEFDYRFLVVVGPFSLNSGDTLKMVYVGAVGQGLSGGVDDYWRGGTYVMGLRQVMDWALKAYYAGSQHSDPLHPSAPDEDEHWKVPVPPLSPALRYGGTPKGVELVWDDLPEKTPDPIKGRIDFVKYRVYRAVYTPQNWKLIAEFGLDPTTGSYPHTYIDTTASAGFSYYYVVTAVDEDGLESAKSNYKKDAAGNPVALVVTSRTGKSLDDVVVVPNPYYGSAPWTATEIGDKVEFQNLPPSCVISIYTLSGDLVRTIVHNNGTGSEAWDLLTKNEQKVVSGVYIYKVTDPDGNYKIGKFMILK